MKKNISGLPSDVREQIQTSEAMPDGEIDTADAQEILD